MKEDPTIRIIINPTGVEKTQLLAADQQTEQAGLELFSKLHQEIHRFTEKVGEILNPEEGSVK